MKRSFDLIVASLATFCLTIPMTIIAALIILTSKGPALFWSNRVGRNNKIFNMPKFRTMQVNTPVVATHILVSPDNYLTWIGKLLRKTSLDELPQLISIIKGDMSLVGPRPALFNQIDLIELRTQRGIHKLTPGLTGWAQINGRDELPIPLKVQYDYWYLEHQSFFLDLKIILLTAIKVMFQKDITY